MLFTGEIRRWRFLSGHSRVLQFTATTEFDNLEAARYLHELEIGNQPLLVREQEGGMGVYNSNTKFVIAIYLASQLHALIVGIKKCWKHKKLLPFYTWTILNYEEKSHQKMRKIAFQREFRETFLREHAPRPPRSSHLWRSRHLPRLFWKVWLRPWAISISLRKMLNKWLRGWLHGWVHWWAHEWVFERMHELTHLLVVSHLYINSTAWRLTHNRPSLASQTEYQNLWFFLFKITNLEYLSNFIKMAQYILLSDDYPLQRKRPTTFANFVHS